MSEELLSITVLIANRPYPLKIRAEDEKMVREVVKDINDKVNGLQLTYSQKDKQDCLSMAVLTYALELEKLKSTDTESQFIDQLDKIDSMLESEFV